MAVSSFKKLSGASTASFLESLSLQAASANVWYSVTPSLQVGTYEIGNPNSKDMQISFLSGSDVIYQKYMTSSTSTFSFYLPENIDTIYFKAAQSSSELTVDLVSAGAALTTSQLSFTSSVQTITSTQSVTFSNPTLVLCMGGGGSGGSARVSAYNSPTAVAGGGGSGYTEVGIIGPGTYTATVGGPGGSTSIGSISASPGSDGQYTTMYSSGTKRGNGGAGGSGGGGGQAAGGINGASGSNYDNNNNNEGRGGAGSGRNASWGAAVGFINVSTSNSVANNGQPGGVYGGGGGSQNTFSSITGTASNSYGGGGSGAAIYGNSGYSSGGSGGPGIIWYRELS